MSETITTGASSQIIYTSTPPISVRRNVAKPSVMTIVRSNAPTIREMRLITRLPAKSSKSHAFLRSSVILLNGENQVSSNCLTEKNCSTNQSKFIQILKNSKYARE